MSDRSRGFNINEVLEREKNIKCISTKRSSLPVFKQFNMDFNSNTISQIKDNRGIRNSTAFDSNHNGFNSSFTELPNPNNYYLRNALLKKPKESFISNSFVDTPLLPYTKEIKDIRSSQHSLGFNNLSCNNLHNYNSFTHTGISKTPPKIIVNKSNDMSG